MGARSIHDREAEISAEVQTETKDSMTAALKYTNEAARKAETRVRISRDAKLQDARLTLDQLTIQHVTSIRAFIRCSA